MAIAFVKNGGVAADKTGGLTALSVTVPTGGHAIGNLVTVVVGSASAAGLTGFTVTDTGGNTYTEIETGTTGVSGQRTTILASVLTTGLAAGNTITATRTGTPTPARFAVSTMEFSGATITENVASAAVAAASGTTLTIGPITPPSAATLVLGAITEMGTTTVTEDSDTNGGAGWNSGPVAQTAGGTATGNIVTWTGYKLTVSSAAQTYNPTIGTARAWAAALVALQAAVSAPGPSQSYRFLRANRFLTSR